MSRSPISRALSLGFALGFTLQSPVGAEPARTFLLSGSCLVWRGGTLYVQLVDEAGFGRKGEATDNLRIDLPNPDRPPLSVLFTFRAPAGRYAIRCFLDLDGDGTLGVGIFGPTEPWGMSWRGKPRIGIPRFEDLSFSVEGDLVIPPIPVR